MYQNVVALVITRLELQSQLQASVGIPRLSMLLRLVATPQMGMTTTIYSPKWMMSC